ncbi:hypothetical protein [Paludisphaera soli]|uniref:hypothetical protein n=1 Tax=Paludisphaera soli TaxID=2712865 RepID=UPI0013EC5BB0|nr:hypothetical protein [Paludisphaera soli]
MKTFITNIHGPVARADPEAERLQLEIENYVKELCLDLQGLCYIICDQDAEVLRRISAGLGQPVGIWGNSVPEVDETGQPYLEPEDSDISKDFKLWAEGENQEYALEHGAYAGMAYFTMVIPAFTSMDILATMYSSCTGCNCYDYVVCMKLVNRFVSVLDWIYVPMADRDLSLVVSSRSNRHFMYRIHRILRPDVDLAE